MYDCSLLHPKRLGAGASLKEAAWRMTLPGLAGFRQMSKTSDFVGKSRSIYGVKSVSINAYFADNVSTSIAIDKSQRRIYSAFILIRERCQQDLLLN